MNTTRALVTDDQDLMPEQATAHDDTIEAGPVPDDGFTVRARLPLAEVPA
ncbi:hypothetical protein [Actinokineospora cianjurensis]|uniref:Uncharacterized protein n=1 Tax=Actinokineospora cianjurensis TaxID=585224 RepID=A0A421BCC2_9PSEU|nr:hypothetical protein [Actinokineospora cianjurensis]RLK61988.1 hypothetical protein CLV68_2538 [Actinokineospora cianjurensis]